MRDVKIQAHVYLNFEPVVKRDLRITKHQNKIWK